MLKSQSRQCWWSSDQSYGVNKKLPICLSISLVTSKARLLQSGCRTNLSDMLVPKIFIILLQGNIHLLTVFFLWQTFIYSVLISSAKIHLIKLWYTLQHVSTKIMLKVNFVMSITWKYDKLLRLCWPLVMKNFRKTE